ncbi:phage tail tape measure protein [Chryseobacterium sp.]|uniref:phage tail tape measure protein n=1 Tax=Chryseobacterium sp. TaxID=1871047 RepID=UPI00289679AD|nr:phage tail tape measure protein [Chryseobacterium sp.]
MSTATTTWVLNISENIIPKFKSMQNEGKAAGDKIDDSFEKAGDEIEKTKKKADKLNDSLKKTSAMDWGAVSNGLRSLNDRLKDTVKPGADFNSAFHDLKALTDATDQQMEKMALSARSLSKEFGGNGAAQLNSYQGILGKLGPEIAQNDAALAKMGRNVSVLSKTMKNDVTGATDALTNSLIQFKVDLSDPMKAAEEMDRMMNVMVASARAGSVEVPEISKALSEAGGVAKMSNLTFEETNALLQGMAKGGVENAKLGVAARNAILKMAAPVTLSNDASAYLQAYGVDLKKVSDTTIPFAERLRELQKIGHDMNALALIFGTENVQGAQAMLSTINYQEELTAKVTGTKDAYDMAKETMESWNEKMGRVKAKVEDFKTGIFEFIAPVTAFTEAATETLAVGSDLAAVYTGTVDPIKNFVKWIKDAGVGQKILSAWTATSTFVQNAWNASVQVGPLKAFSMWIRNSALGQKLSAAWTAISTYVQNAYNASVQVGPLKAFTMWIRNSALAQKLSTLWTGVATAAQWAWNAALTANPIGLLIVGIAALIGFVVAAIAYWDDWGATFIWLLGPIGLIISAFKNIYDKWDSIKEAFKSEGIIGGLKRLGTVLLDVLLKPLQQVSGWIDKIFNTDLSSGVKKLRGELDLITEDERKKEAEDAKKEREENTAKSPNPSAKVVKPKKLTDKEKIDIAIKEGRLVMYMGKPVLPSTRDRIEAEKAKTPPTTLSPESILGKDKDKKKKKGKKKGEGSDGETSTGSGNGGSVKSITVTVTMNNHFHVDKSYGSLENVANKVIGKINDRLRDSIVAID